MQCPNCGHTKQIVADSRPVKNTIRRRRVCKKCRRRFFTTETVEPVNLVAALGAMRTVRSDLHNMMTMLRQLDERLAKLEDDG